MRGHSDGRASGARKRMRANALALDPGAPQGPVVGVCYPPRGARKVLEGWFITTSDSDPYLLRAAAFAGASRVRVRARTLQGIFRGLVHNL